MEFQIIRDARNQEDRFSGSYAIALMKECKEQGVPYTVVDKIVDKNAPSVLLYPNSPMPGSSYKNYLEMDNQVTKSVVYLMLLKKLAEGDYKPGFGNEPMKVCIYGAGENVGMPLAKMLDDTGDAVKTWKVRSSTAESAREAAIRECDFIVVATPHGVRFPYSLAGKTVFDVSGNVRDQKNVAKEFISSSDIGKQVVQEVVGNAKKVIAANWNPWEDKYLTGVNTELEFLMEPPCKKCEHWHPRAVTDNKGIVKTIRCCMSDKMFDDFSCYNPKATGINPESFRIK